MTQIIMRIAVPSPLQRSFDYLLPKNCTELPMPGMRMCVPFGRRKLIGILLEVANQSSLALNRLKQIDAVLDKQPLLDHDLQQLLGWASQYYQHPIGEVMLQALPALLRNGGSTDIDTEYLWRTTAAANTAVLSRAPKQQALVEFLQKHPLGASDDQLREHGFSARLWQQLSAKNIIERIEVTEPVKAKPIPSQGHALNDAQQLAVDTICQQTDSFHCFLLQGVTGSGKTEVYLRALQHVLTQGKQALVLVPEIALTPQTVARFEQRFNTSVGVLHSGLTDKQRLKTWLMAKNGDFSLIIGTRSAIFTAFKDLGMIVIDEEHDTSFKQQDNFRYSARDLAVRRAHIEAIPIVLGTATPSLESLYNAKQGRYQLLSLPERAGTAQQPSFKLVDMCKQHLQAGLTPCLLDAMRAHLGRGNQVLLFLNRRGFATTLLCHDCGWSAQCSRCEVPLTLHQQTKRLHCHHCGGQQRIFSHCPECQSSQLINLGVGTERLEMELAPLFANHEIIRIDRDSTRLKGSIENKLDAIHQGREQILIGTQMLAKGHHFPDVTLVGILNADQGLLSTDFRATERVGQLLMQVSGRAGRAEKPGEVLIQTHQPRNPLLLALTQSGYAEFADELLLERQATQLPPFSFLALLRAESVNAKTAEKFLHEVKQRCQELAIENVALLGPIPAPMPKRAGRHRAQLLLRANKRSELQKLLQPLRQTLEQMKMGRQVRWSIDVDPQELF